MRAESNSGTFVYEIESINRRIGLGEVDDEKKVGMRVKSALPIEKGFPLVMQEVGTDYNFRTTRIDEVEHLDDFSANVLYTQNTVYKLRIVPDTPKYPEHIMRFVRQAFGTDDPNDTSLDAEINELRKEKVLDLYFQWQGIIGYGSSIKSAVEEIWGVKLT